MRCVPVAAAISLCNASPGFKSPILTRLFTTATRRKLRPPFSPRNIFDTSSFKATAKNASPPRSPASTSTIHFSPLEIITLSFAISEAFNTAAFAFPIAPYELRRPIHHPLGRIDGLDARLLRIPPLPLRQRLRRIRLVPPDVTPIVDMLAQYDHPGWIQLRQQRIGGRTT